MNKRDLGRTGMRISVIGFGGIPVQGIPNDEATKVLLSAFDSGINFVDTARGYTDSEEKIGRALAGRREEIVLATKAMNTDSAGMTEALEESLKTLHTDYIDLYQIHGVPSVEKLDEAVGPGGAYEALSRAREQGKVRFIGVTGHIHDVLKKAVETDLFDTVQLPFNPIETDGLYSVIPAAKERNVGIIAMKPAAGGALRNVPAALRFSLANGVDVVIPGMDSVEQVLENATAGENLRPPSEEETQALTREKEVWKGEFCRRCAYCMPCPSGLNIPLLLLCQAYYVRYNLREWSLARLSGLDKGYGDCEACGECLERCPYDLDIPKLMDRAAKEVV